ncbi:MAG: purine-nucleoside phosphorylase [Pirellulaceae bacterium]
MLNELTSLLDCDTIALREAVARARDAITAIKLWQPQVAIILGSGLSGLADCIAHATTIDYGHIPHFLPTHAVGHEGKLILGYLSGVPVAMMQGRTHRYEGYANCEVAFPVHVMHALGASMLITTNAAGGLNTRYQAGDLMVIDSHIDFLWPRGQTGAPQLRPAIRGPSPYDQQLLHNARNIARLSCTTLHQGCYLATLGPTYETRSEYRMFRWAGADAVGMSTLPEVYAARELEMQVLAFSVITNVASTDVPVSTNHAEVVETGNSAGPRLMNIIQQLLEELAGPPD